MRTGGIASQDVAEAAAVGFSAAVDLRGGDAVVGLEVGEEVGGEEDVVDGVVGEGGVLPCVLLFVFK